MSLSTLWKTMGTALVALWLSAVAVPAAAQGSSSITGTIVDTSGGVLPGVTVTVLNIGSGRENVIVTDAKGQYKAEVAPGAYRVTARLAGFSDSGKSTTVDRAQPAKVDFTLSLGGLSENITVTAAKGERATAEVNQIVTVVTSEDIENRRPQGVEEAFERAPNVRQEDTNPYRAKPVFRGFSNGRILMVIDGERLNNGRYDVNNSGVTPSTVDVTQIQSIEVVGGAASSLYGSDAIAGTINIITKTADRPQSGSTLDLQTTFDFNSNSAFRRGNFAATYASPKLAIRGAISGFKQPDYSSGGTAINKADVVRLGQFLADGGALVGRAIASTFTVFDLPAGGKVPNGGADGYTYNIDASVYPNEKNLVRVKWMSNRFTDLGLPFSMPPYDTFQRISSFANFDKFSARYESREIAPWFPRLSVSGYMQEMKRPQNDIAGAIAAGSSYNGSTLTGATSQFVPGSNTETINDIKSKGFDVQANLQPMKHVQFTTGVAYLMDTSIDTFNRSTFSAAGATLTTVAGAKTTPDTDYKNLGWYNQAEVTVAKHLKFSGGFRVDNWKTEAKPSAGFPAGNEFKSIQAALPQILANPGDIKVAGISGLDALAAGTGGLATNTTSTTGNIGLTVLLPGGINPYVRYATSYREPEITVRYLVRNFGPPTLSIPSLPNTTVQPESGKNIDLGVKVEKERLRMQLGWFQNKLSNAVSTVYSPNYCIPADAANGLLPTPFPPCVLSRSHNVQFFQRVNVPGDVTVKGFEASGEVSIPVGSHSSLSPYIGLGWQQGTMSNPTTTDIQLMNAYYNRSDTAIKLEGSASDAPYGQLPAWSGTFALKYADSRAKWWAEYELRFATQITRVEADSLFSVNFPLYGSLSSMQGYKKHSIRAGYDLSPKVPIKLNLGLENLNNALYFLPFQSAPGPGFSVVFGATINVKMKLQ